MGVIPYSPKKVPFRVEKLPKIPRRDCRSFVDGEFQRSRALHLLQRVIWPSQGRNVRANTSYKAHDRIHRSKAVYEAGASKRGPLFLAAPRLTTSEYSHRGQRRNHADEGLRLLHLHAAGHALRAVRQEHSRRGKDASKASPQRQPVGR